MTSYAVLMVGSLKLGKTEDFPDYGVMSIFRPSEKIIDRIPLEDEERLDRYIPTWQLHDEENAPFVRVAYSTSVGVALDRLDFLGYTYEAATKGFFNALAAERKYFRQRSKDSAYAQSELQDLDHLDFELWIRLLRRVWQVYCSTGSIDFRPKRPRHNRLLRYMLQSYGEYFGFPGLTSTLSDDDNRVFFIRLFLEQVDPQEQLSYEFGSMIEYYASESKQEEIDSVVGTAEAFLEPNPFRIHILTEGNTDNSALEGSMKLLYPHMAEYLDFSRFDIRGVGNNAAARVQQVLILAAAGVQHRILALFDNDLAGREASEQLKRKNLPGNFVTRCYPDTHLAQHYPTVGPLGGAKADINRLAASLELYLGVDTLTVDGQLSPVRWTGYNPRSDSWHGEVKDKSRVLKAFKGRLKECQRHPDRINRYDWTGIEAVFHTIMTAFHHLDQEEK